MTDEDKARISAIIVATNRYEDSCSAADADAARAAARSRRGSGRASRRCARQRGRRR